MPSTGFVSSSHIVDTAESFADIHVAFYYTFKFVLVLWMAMPQFGYVLSRPNQSLVSILIYQNSAVHKWSTARSSSQYSLATSRKVARPPPIFAPRPIKLPSLTPCRRMLMTFMSGCYNWDWPSRDVWSSWKQSLVEESTRS